jgi:hypothetical protein
MKDRAKRLKLLAIIASFYALLSLIIILVISGADGISIYLYISFIISLIPCVGLWKMYADEKKRKDK